MKTRKDNDMTDRKGVISVKCNIELSKSNRYCVVYEKDEIGERRD